MSRDASPLFAGEIGQRMLALGDLLRSTSDRWRPRPFAAVPVDWEPAAPDVSRWLRGLDHAEIDAIDADGVFGDSAPSAVREWNTQAKALAWVGEIARATVPAPLNTRQIKRHKRAQISAFMSCVSDASGFGSQPRLVDWCCGKGHLGRLVASQFGLTLLGIEYRKDLCESGLKLALDAGIDASFSCVDARTELAANLIESGDTAVALHACGALGDALLKVATDRQPHALMLSPCCPHRVASGPYRPRSELGKANDIQLDQHLLRLPTADEVGARDRRRELRRRSMAWRLGFDLLVREATGVDAYHPAGAVARPEFDRPFGDFCHWLSARSGLPLPPRFDPDQSEAAGVERARIARALGLVRGIYRRPLELWLVLDRAQTQLEAGRETTVGTFCDRALTPRNLMIISKRPL
ncbi:MAG: hypothetical protein ACI9OJ_005401 [Myxococcota bacterium]